MIGLVIYKNYSMPVVEDNRTQKIMTREERLKICEDCQHCARDRRGMVCGKTNEYADFDGECREFEPSKKCLEKIKIKHKKERLTVDDNYVPPLAYIIYGAVWLLLMYALEDGSGGITDIMFPVSIIAAICSIIAGIVLFFIRWMKRKKIEAEIFQAHTLTNEKIMDIIRFEGYYPQLNDDGIISFKIEGSTYCIDRDGAKLRLSYVRALSPLELGVTVAQIKELAAAVSEGIIMAKVDFEELSEGDRLGIITYLYTFCYYDEELRKAFPVYLNIVQEAMARFGRGLELLPKESPRRDDIYQPEFRWLPDVIFKAVSEERLAPEALVDEEWIRTKIKKGISTSEIAKEWVSFKINRVDNYGDYKLIVYQFPEPKVVPEAKYGAVLMNTKTLEIDYYTLEMTYNGKWVYGSMTTERHSNYGEVDTDDLDKFIEWIFTKDKQVVASQDYTKERNETVN